MSPKFRLPDSNVKFERIVAAFDCGVAVNPNIIVGQIQLSVDFARLAVLCNRVTPKRRVVEHDEEPTRISEIQRVEVISSSLLSHPSALAS
jgi:isoquinoline 1-oxidoreductase beta subunit